MSYTVRPPHTNYAILKSGQFASPAADGDDFFRFLEKSDDSSFGQREIKGQVAEIRTGGN
jgi:hypothetical protein